MVLLFIIQRVGGKWGEENEKENIAKPQEKCPSLP